MSNELNRVKKRLFQEGVKLESHAVELALIDDLKKSISVFDASLSSFDELKSKYSELQSNAKKLFSEIEKSEKTLEKLKSSFEKQANELGLNPKDSTHYGIAESNLEIANNVKNKIKALNLI